jgi:hypothetical protein
MSCSSITFLLVLLVRRRGGRTSWYMWGSWGSKVVNYSLFENELNLRVILEFASRRCWW